MHSTEAGRYLARSLALIPVLLAASAVPALAAVGDTAAHTPPLYDTFVPPAAGASYDDQAFGTAVTRVSDAMSMADAAGAGTVASVGTEYSTASAFNSDNTRLLLLHRSYFALYDGAGHYLGNLPLPASSEPRWSRREPNVVYFVSGNKLAKLDVTSGLTTLVHSFDEYASISGKGESDISRDGDHFVLAGDDRQVFVYEISSDRKGPALDTAGHAFDALYIASDNSVAVAWLPSGTDRFTGVELFSREMTFLRQLTHANGHMHLTRDASADVLVWTNSGDPLPLEGCANGIVKIALADARQTCLLTLDWSLAVHVTAPDGSGWAFVETYAPSDPQPESGAWAPFTNEILQVRLDGGEVRRLLHHRSRPRNGYTYQPRATVSRDGSRLVFSSNFNLQSLLGYPSEYSDAYLVAVPGAASSAKRR